MRHSLLLLLLTLLKIQLGNIIYQSDTSDYRATRTSKNLRGQ